MRFCCMQDTIHSINTFGVTTPKFFRGDFKKFSMLMKLKDFIGKILSKSQHNNVHYFTDRGVRPIYMESPPIKGTPPIPEMIPEIIVPDLEGFKLKPYVSYRVPDVIQSEFTPQDLFYAVYSNKIAEDFKNNKLNSDGNSLEPSPDELMTPEEAKGRARSTGSDIFSSFIDHSVDHKSTH
ncbi:unnamed protein product, partial [Meganyctiphanes norvegica]